MRTVENNNAIVLYSSSNEDLFVDIEVLNIWKKIHKDMKYEFFYPSIVRGFGKNVFVFDVNSCTFKEGE